MAEDEVRHQFQRVCRIGPVIIDEDHLAAGRHAPEQRVNDSVLVVVRQLVKEEETTDRVEDPFAGMSGVSEPNSHMTDAAQLALATGDLDEGNVEYSRLAM